MLRTVCGIVTLAITLSFAAPASAASAADFSKALAIAQAKVPAGATLLHARIEGQSITSVYGFYFLYKTRVIEVEVTRTGLVIKQKDSKDDVVSKDVMQLLGKKNGPAKLPAGRLLEIAADSLKGTQFDGIKYEIVNNKLVITFGDTVIDAETGDVTTGGSGR